MCKYISVAKYNRWVEKMYLNSPFSALSATHAFNYGYVKDGNYILTYNKNKNVLRITNIKTGKTGWSKKNKKDTFNSKIAIAIAWARYCKTNIPKTYEFLNIESFNNITPGTIIHDHMFDSDDIFVATDPLSKSNIIVWAKNSRNCRELMSVDVCEKRYTMKE